MKNTQFKGEEDDVGATKEENDFPFPNRNNLEAARTELKCTSSVLLSTTTSYMKTKKLNSFL